MISRTSSTLSRAKNTSLRRRALTLVGGLSAVVLLFAGIPANAAPAHFHYAGGRWSHAYHSGWHRYWGGPSIGFYYAPTPVYVVPGYAAPSYYTGPDFWVSNPSFGISLNFGGGGGYYGGGYRSDRYYHGGGGHYQASHYSGGGHYNGGGRSVGAGRPSGGGHSGGDRGHR